MSGNGGERSSRTRRPARSPGRSRSAYVQQPCDHRERVHHQEIAEVLTDHAADRCRGSAPAPAAAREDQDRDSDHHHRKRRQHERRAEDRADADLLARGVPRGDRDDRQDRLGQRRTDGREHRADGALGQAEALPDPFDAVREQLCAGQDHEQRDNQQDPIHMDEHAPRAARVATSDDDPAAGRPRAPKRSTRLRSRPACGGHRPSGSAGPSRTCPTGSRRCCSGSRSSAPHSSCPGRRRWRNSTSRRDWPSPCSR